MVRTCCVVGCNVRFYDRHGNKFGLSFYAFPTWKQHEGAHVSDITKRRRLAWIAAVRRADIKFCYVSRYQLVCSRHFHSAAARRKRRPRRRRTSAQPESGVSSEQSPGPEPLAEAASESVSAVIFGSEEMSPQITAQDIAEREQVVLAELEEKLRWKPWLTPDYEQVFRGTRLALGGPRSCQGLPPFTSPATGASVTASPSGKRRRRRHRGAARQLEVGEGLVSSRAPSEMEVSDCTFAPRVFSVGEIMATIELLPGGLSHEKDDRVTESESGQMPVLPAKVSMENCI
uniref:THAP-type domain-containing protein n=1 Tax=Astatotilapia calliptera TaxID=8154 RepID=A0AAX7T2N3_ASTCA